MKVFSLVQQHSQDLLWEGAHRVHAAVASSGMVFRAAGLGSGDRRGSSALVYEAWEPAVYGGLRVDVAAEELPSRSEL